MKSYLVGGAVRDSLLGRLVTEKDYVVVGGNEKEMLALGFKPVGNDFPVFLHPETKEEYALARTERKVAKGYRGFVCDTGSRVSLEDDLLRRDLTINAMAQDETGQLIDPHGGSADLKARVLRHVSPAFVEDAVRILRLARFAARFHHLGFKVAKETTALMIQMVQSGDVDNLVPERVFAELKKALLEKDPAVFFQVLRSCGALKIVMPEIDALFGVPATKKYHGEVDTGVHTMMALEVACKLSDALAPRFAVLVHDLGKALTPMSEWPSHRGHDKKGVEPIIVFCQRMRVPNALKSLASLVAEHHIHIHKVEELKPATIVKLLHKLKAIKQPEQFEEILLACKADAVGRIGGEDRPYKQFNLMKQYRDVVASVDVQAIIKEGFSGEQIQKALYEKQVEALKDYLDA